MRMRGPVTVPPSRSRALLMLAVSSCCERTSQSSAIMARATPRMLAATHQSVETRISQRHASRTGEALSPACLRPRSSSLPANDRSWTALKRRDRIGSPRIRRRGGRAARAAASRIAACQPSASALARRPARCMEIREIDKFCLSHVCSKILKIGSSACRSHGRSSPYTIAVTSMIYHVSSEAARSLPRSLAAAPLFSPLVSSPPCRPSSSSPWRVG